MLVIDNSTCMLYELYVAQVQGLVMQEMLWHCLCAATAHMQGNSWFPPGGHLSPSPLKIEGCTAQAIFLCPSFLYDSSPTQPPCQLSYCIF